MDGETQIYLDHAAATPLRPEARDAMAPWLEGVAGNPSSPHRWGREARAGLERAREIVASSLNVPPETVHFVRGGTESVNLALLGRAERLGIPVVQGSVWLRTTIEHSAVKEALAEIERRGASVRVMGVSPEGEVDTPSASELREGGAALLSAQWVNHEVGTILPIADICELACDAGVAMHVDAMQAAGKVPIDAFPAGQVLLSVSSHKVGGPRGMGVLCVPDRDLIWPRLFGGGQESGLRPGTEDVGAAVGMAVALEMAVSRLQTEGPRLRDLRRRLEDELMTRLPSIHVHGREGPRAPHILNIGVEGLPRDILPVALDLEGLAVSAGSACRSGSTEPSPVLEALYGSSASAVAPLRLSLGWSTTEEDVRAAAEIVVGVVERAWNVA